MPIRMPTDTALALGSNAENCDSRSLLLDKFADPTAKENARKAVFTRAFAHKPEEQKVVSWLAWLEQCAKRGTGVPPVISDQHSRDGCATLLIFAQLKSRLMVNMAGGVMENAGMCLDRFGVPYIPGSAVKGCARRMAIQKLLDAGEQQNNTAIPAVSSDQSSTAVPAVSSDQSGTAVPAVSFHPYNPEISTQKSRRNLPHWNQEGRTYFVTFRLADSLPREKLQELQTGRDNWLRTHPKPWDDATCDEYNCLFSDKIETWLDSGEGACLLAQTDVSRIVEDTLCHFDGQRYDLDAYVIMPNHVHALVTPREGWQLDEILHSWKSFTAHEINKLVGHSGHVWQDESFDHIVRSEAQLERYRRYIEENPRKGRLSEGRYRTGMGRRYDHSRDGCATFATSTALDKILIRIAIVFGWCEQDWSEKRDKNGCFISDFAYACGTQWNESLVRRVQTELWRKALGSEPDADDRNFRRDWKRRLANFAGSVAFLPAYPVNLPKGRHEDLPIEAPDFGKLELDIVTCHHPQYYRGELPVATDTEEPKPVVFPSVAPGHVFAFALAPLRGCPGDRMEKARDWLKEGLETFGLGAKTAAGYGWFDCNEAVQDGCRQAFKKQREEQEEEARIRADEERKKAEEQAARKQAEEQKQAMAGMTDEQKADHEIVQMTLQQFRTHVEKYKGLASLQQAAVMRALRGAHADFWQNMKFWAEKGKARERDRWRPIVQAVYVTAKAAKQKMP